MAKRNALRLYRGDAHNPEGRAGEPKKADGKRFLHVWFTYESFWSYATDRMMANLVKDKVVTRRRSNETVLYERVRFVYYSHLEGCFYIPESNKNAEKKGDAFLLKPFSGTIRTCYPMYQAKNGLPDCEITCIDGYPTSLTMDGMAFDVDATSWPAMEGFLGLDEQYKPERYRPDWSVAV